MPNYQISLSEEIYRSLLTVAESSGVSPADWIAAQLPPNSFTPQSIIESVTDLIGTINSQAEPHQSYEKDVLGEAIADKLAKQGIRRP